MEASLESSLVLAGSGDEAAFDAVYRATSPRVLGLTTRILRNRSLAEEVAQEAYLQAWQQSHRFDPERGSAIGWLMRIAHARAVDRVRRDQSERDRDVLDHAKQAAAWVAPVAEHAELSVEARRVREAMGRLSRVHRESIFLAYFGGMTQSEIAEHLGVPLGTAKTRIRDGMRRLRALLGATGLAPSQQLKRPAPLRSCRGASSLRERDQSVGSSAICSCSS